MKEDLIKEFFNVVQKIKPILNQQSIIKATSVNTRLSGLAIACLFVINNNDGPSMRMISDEMEISKQQLTKITRTLKLYKLIREETDKDNKSRKNVYLTDKGHEIVDIVKSDFINDLKESLDSLSEAEIKRATELLIELSSLLKKRS